MAFANMNEKQFNKVTGIMRTLLDDIAIRNFAYEEGRSDVLKALLKAGVPEEQIKDALKLSAEELAKLKEG